MATQIALFGSACNPPGKHHLKIAQALRGNDFRVPTLPCGPRPDKETIDDVAPIHRAIMTDMTFGGQDGIDVYLDDLERAEFTRTHELIKRFERFGEVWNYVGSDLIKGGAQGEAYIQRVWRHGDHLWRNARFIIGKRPGYPIVNADLPPHSQVLDLDFDDSSTHIREAIFRHEPFDHLVVPRVHDYINRYNLYRGHVPMCSSSFRLDDPRPFVYFDERNPKARRFARKFTHHDNADANCIIVIGGDGTMLHAIQQLWRKRLPFFGINAGHLGYLLNLVGPKFKLSDLSNLFVYHLPLLYVEVTARDGNVTGYYALNDAWLERSSKQSAWLRVIIDGKTKIQRLIGDGALISTAAGSTAYAEVIGATPLRLDMANMLFVPNNIAAPRIWKRRFEPLSLDSTVAMKCLDPDKRPVRACIDSEVIENAVELRVRASRTAAVELLQFSNEDMARKRIRLYSR